MIAVVHLLAGRRAQCRGVRSKQRGCRKADALPVGALALLLRVW